MSRLVVSEDTDSDAEIILRDLGLKAGLPTVIKFSSLFRALYDRLVDHPESGPARAALGKNIRIGIVSPFIIIYQYSPEDDTVTILRIVHGRRKISGRLLSRNL